jgi:hypothetical protein
VFIQATIKLRKEATSDVIAILQTVITSEGIEKKIKWLFIISGQGDGVSHRH